MTSARRGHMTKRIAALFATVAVLTLGHSLLGVTGRWELFARGAEEVVRIEPAGGRITRTAVPALLSGAPVSFVVTPDRAVVRSIDQVPGDGVLAGGSVQSLGGL